jgi:hypothetical protein
MTCFIKHDHSGSEKAPLTRYTAAECLAEPDGGPFGFIPLEQENRTHVSTKVMCRHLGRKEQTARGWACHEDGPLRPIRVNGRLAWAVADIKRLLGV